jgi:hypothetical protein
MEIRLSLLLLAVLLMAGVALSASHPRAVSDPMAAETRALAELEDAAALARGDLDVARKLTTAYLRLGQPGLVIAAVRSAQPELARDPLLTHRLSQAYEASGRVDDALTTAQLAFARCTTPDAGMTGCNIATLTALEVHLSALAMLQRWGVQEPRRDTRTALAYQLAQRTARIASLGVTTPIGE